jgi:hypothetical protein
LAKVISLKLEVPGDDDVPVAAAKAFLQEAIRRMGPVKDVGAPEGQSTLMERTLFLDACTVKEWRPGGERKKAANGARS